MGCKINKWDQDAEEAQDVHYQYYAFEIRESFATNGIDDD